MRLRRSELRGPGLRRVRRGKGFSYYDPDGAPITDAETLDRIKDLVIPPAWKKVWICAHPNGHIQAVGTDVAGRRQYLYHQKWQKERNEEKFDRALHMSAGLPDMRRQIASDLRGRGLTRDRVIALALQLLDLGYFRSGVRAVRRGEQLVRPRDPALRTRDAPTRTRSSSTIRPRAGFVGPC